jgi:hypothetical protein
LIERGVSDASAATIWRWLHDAAIKPWQVRSWLFPRDPDFAAKAGGVLDLYARRFEGRRLRPDELVICACARRVFWIVDNGSAHAGRASIDRLEGADPNLRLIHLPVHASWLNQIELYFSIVQRKALRPNDFGSLDELSGRLLSFQAHYAEIARPFEWTFTRADLDRVLAKVAEREPHLQLAA